MPIGSQQGNRPAPDGDAGNTVVIALPVQPRALLRWLLLVSGALAVVSAIAAIVVVYGADLPYNVVARIDVDAESGVPAWFSALQLFFCALLIMPIAYGERRGRFARYWWVLATGFVFLSLDEISSYHEWFNDRLVSLVHRGPTFLWTIPAMAGATVVGLLFVPFLRHLPRRYRTMFLVAGATFIFAAAGLELVGGAIIDAHGGHDRESSTRNLPYVAESTVEEFLEMASVALFVYALASYESERRLERALDVSRRPSRAPTFDGRTVAESR